MWDSIQKLEYRARAGIADAREEVNTRLTDRLELPLSGLHGESKPCAAKLLGFLMTSISSSS